MGRHKKIDRDALLDAAEEIVLAQGPAALTIEALAVALGISKGGVQYSFKSKDELIEAIIERWTSLYDSVFDSLVGEDAGPDEVLAAHLEATRRAEDLTSARATGVLTVLLQGDHAVPMREWYRELLDMLHTDDEAGRRRRSVFLAIEGAFLLRALGMIDLRPGEWEDMLNDLKISGVK